MVGVGGGGGGGGVVVGRWGGRLIAERVMGGAEGERREGERRVCIESPAEGGGRASRLAGLEGDQPVDELRVSIERITREQRLHLGECNVKVTLARRGEGDREPPPARGLTRRRRLTAARACGPAAAGRRSRRSWARAVRGGGPHPPPARA